MAPLDGSLNTTKTAQEWSEEHNIELSLSIQLPNSPDYKSDQASKGCWTYSIHRGPTKDWRSDFWRILTARSTHWGLRHIPLVSPGWKPLASWGAVAIRVCSQPETVPVLWIAYSFFLLVHTAATLIEKALACSMQLSLYCTLNFWFSPPNMNLCCCL